MLKMMVSLFSFRDMYFSNFAKRKEGGVQENHKNGEKLEGWNVGKKTEGRKYVRCKWKGEMSNGEVE